MSGIRDGKQDGGAGVRGAVAPQGAGTASGQSETPGAIAAPGAGAALGAGAASGAGGARGARVTRGGELVSHGKTSAGRRAGWVRAVRRHGPAYLFLLPYASSFGAFVVVPFCVALGLAFMQFDLTARESTRFVGVRNFTEALADPYFWMALRATVYYAVLIVPASVVVAMGLAVGMNAMTRGRNTVRALLFIPGMLNVAVVGILWQWFYNREFGLLAFVLRSVGLEAIPFLSDAWLAMPAVVVMSMWWGVGGSAVVLLTGLQQIPTSLYEAAEIDGAGKWQQFWLITLPMLRPVLVFTVVMGTIGAFQVFGQPFILTRGGPEFMTRGVVQYIYETAFNQYRMGYGAALSWLLFLMIAGFSVVQNFLIRRGG